LFKRRKKIISLVTVLCFMVNILLFNSQLSFASDEKDVPDQVLERQEIVSDRTAYSKRYQNPDGTITEEVYSNPVHYQDLQGHWLDINNNLEPQNDNEFGFLSNGGKTKFSYSDRTGNQSLVRFQTENKWVEFNPVGATVAADVYNAIPIQDHSVVDDIYGNMAGDAITYTEINQDFSVAKDVCGNVAGDTITYQDIFNNTSFTYKSCFHSLKESIILEKPAFNFFSFEINLHELDLVKSETGQLLLTDPQSGEPVAYFSLPFMQDSNGVTSNAVSLSFREEGNKKYLDLCADNSWLTSEERAYPVVIDPTISLYDEPDDTYVSSANPDTSYSGLNYLYVGDKAGLGTTRSFMNFVLPSLPSSARIDQAYISVYQYLDSPPSTTLNAYPLTGTWGSTRTWNTQPSVGSLAGSVTGNNSGYWNITITDLVKDWYNGVSNNYGLCLKLDNETQSALEYYSKEQGSNVPMLSITYTVDPIGIENFWTLSKDGINMASGNLVFQKNDLTIPGRGSIIEFNRTYNSRSSNTGLTGYGWSSNWETRLKVPPNFYGPVTLVDEDGTEHIFARQTNGSYTPPNGIYLQLVKNANNTFTITQPDGAKDNFSSTGKLLSIVDTNGNTLSFNYDTNCILQSVRDASNRSATLSYNAAGLLWKITDPASNVVEFGYDANGNLTSDINQAGKQTTYSYDSNHNLTSVTNPKGNTVNYTYDQNGNVVTSSSKTITINGTPQTSTTSFQYSSGPHTTVTDAKGHVTDYDYNAYCNITDISQDPSVLNYCTTFDYDTYNNLSSVTEPNTNAGINTGTYDFTWDTSGNMLTQTDPLYQQCSYSYDSSNNLTTVNYPESTSLSFSYDTKNNNTGMTDSYLQTVDLKYDSYGNNTSQTNTIPANQNSIINQSFERDANSDSWPDDWDRFIESGKTATFSWSTTALYGPRSASIDNPTGTAYISTAQLLPIDSSKSYTISSYVKTNNLTTNGARMKVDACDNGGTVLGQIDSGQLSGTHDWTRMVILITPDKLPVNTTKLRANLGIFGAATGTAYFDGVQLEEGSPLTSYNTIENPGFEKYTGTLPKNWTGGNLTSYDTVTTSYSYEGATSFKFKGSGGTNKYLKHHILLTGNQNNSYTISGWSRADGASPSGGSYALEARVNYTDATTGYFNNSFTKSSHDWEHITATVQPTKAFSSIDIYCLYYNQAGYAYFDAVRLQEGKSITSFAYNTNGYQTGSTDPLGNQVSINYDTIGNATSVTDARNYTTEFSYNELNCIDTVTDPNNEVTSYGYDDNGNLSSITDANNHITSYQYNELDLLKSDIDPLNRTTSYEYDLVGNLSKLQYPNGNTVEYDYNNVDRLASIYENGTQKWSFQYDPNGNRTRMTDVVNSLDTNYSYSSANQLSTISYPGGNQVSYTYDQAGKVFAVTTNINSSNYAHNFTYDKINQNIKVSSPNSCTEYIFDENGNISRVNNGNGSYSIQQYNSISQMISLRNYAPNGNILSSFSYTYDSNGNCTSVTTSTGTIQYQYDALNRLSQESYPNGKIINYNYDAVGNCLSRMVTINGNSTTTNYNYDEADQLINVDGQVYTYDDNGNLTNDGIKTYIYDAQNRLVQVRNGTTVLASFTYDADGKRTSLTTSSTTRYLYDGNNVIAELDASNNVIARYTYNASGHLVSMMRDGQTYYYHFNGHGDVIALTDNNGTVVATYDYDAWGNITGSTGSVVNPYRYEGYRYDEATGLYFTNCFYYNPLINYFISKNISSDQSINKDYNNDFNVCCVALVLRALVMMARVLAVKVFLKVYMKIKKLIDKALLGKYKFEGPGSGGRIFRIAKKITNVTVFRLDYFPIHYSENDYLHYHKGKDEKIHYVIWPELEDKLKKKKYKDVIYVGLDFDAPEE